MKNLFEKFLELMKSFERNDVEYIIIGGIAINLHGFARNTQDVDIFINPDKENIQKLKNALKEVFDDPEIDEITFEELQKYSVIRYGTEYGFYIDIISAIGEKFKFSDLEFEKRVIEGTEIKFAGLKSLYKMKEKTYREIDQLDLKFIKSKLGK